MSKQPVTTNPVGLRRHFIEALYKTLEGVVSPTPYMEISEGSTVDVKFLNGRGLLPSPNSTEVTILDIDIASLFFDRFHILYDGVTGIGKTYTSDAVFNAVFGSDGYRTLRLSGGILGSSVLDPFTTTSLEDGIPKTRIDPVKCGLYGGLFIDEINRGDAQEVLQVVDGVVHVNGDTGYLRIPIPGTNGRFKRLAVIGAMNPADALHSAAVELDIAGENRFLKVRFPNGVAEAGASQLEKRVADNLHEVLWEDFRKRTGRSGGWRENYPIIADPEQLEDAINGQTRELIDVGLGYVGHDPKETCARNVEIMMQGGVSPGFAVRDDNDYQKILRTQATLKHGFVRRDLDKIRNLSRLLAFIKGTKRGTYDAAVAFNDVAASVGVILESKTMTGTEYGGLMTLVNDARTKYSAIHRDMNIPAGYGVRQAVWQAAIHVGVERGFDGYIGAINQAISRLNVATLTAADAAIRSRMVADLVVLRHFSQTYQADVTAALTEKGEAAFTAFGTMYDAKKKASSVYEHRLDSMMR